MKLSSQTLSMAGHYLDKDMRKKQCRESNFNSLALISLILAGKFEESYTNVSIKKFITTAKTKSSVN